MNRIIPNSSLIIFLFIILNTASFAQNGFERVYGDVNDITVSIHLTHDSAYILGGSSLNFAPAYHAYVLKINNQGDSLWSKYYSDSWFSGAGGITELLTHYYAVPGTEPDPHILNSGVAAVRLLDSTGTLSGGSSYPEPDAWSTSGKFLISNRDSGFAFTYYTDGYTADNYDRVNVKGKTFNWEDLLGGEGIGWPFEIGRNSLSQNSSGEYYAQVNYGSVFGTNISPGCSVKKWSEAGALLFDTIYDWGILAQSIFATDDGGALFCGNGPVSLVKIDSTGNVEWNYTYSNIPCNNAVQAIQTKDHGYAVISSSGPIGIDTNNISLLKFDNNGNLLWIRNFGGINNDDPLEVRETMDSGFIILGHTNSFGSKHIYVIKTDSLGFINQNYFITSSSNMYCIGDTAYLSVQPALSYQWSNGDSGQSIAVTQSGTYRVTVADSSGNFQTTGYYSVYFNPLPFAELNLDSVTGICQNNILLNNLTNYPGLQYDWYLNDTLLPDHGQQFSPALTGLYKLIVSNNCGIASDSVMIDTIYSLPPIPVASPSYSQICPGDSLVLTTPFDSLYTYQWFHSTKFYLPYSPVLNANDTSLSAMNEGYYEIGITDGNGCTSMSTNYAQLDFYQRPEISYAGYTPADTGLCPHDSVRLFACCGTTQLWNTGETSAFLWAKDPGDYSAISFTNGSCPLASDTFHLTIQNELQISLGNDTSVCGGSSITLHAGAWYDAYHWNDGSTGDSLLVTIPGTYSIFVELEYSCPGWDTIQVRFGATPSLNLGPDTAMCNTATFNLDAGPAFASYEWNDGSGNQTLLASTISTGIDTANYFVTVTDSNGCSNQDSIQIIFTICSGVSQKEFDNDLTIYPNPATNEITLDLNYFNQHPKLFFKLYDLTGRLVKNITIDKSEQKISLVGLPASVYQYTITSLDQDLTCGKLILE